MNKMLSAGLAGALAVTLALPAAAHTGHTVDGTLLRGFLHPLSGIDHLLAMVAVGVWAAQNGVGAVWLLPTAFVAMLAGGAVLGMAGVALPAVAAGIAASVAVLNKRVPVVAGMALVGAFAVLHGHAHGAEMPQAAQPLLYGFGFVTATVLLYGVGIAIGLAHRLVRDPAACPATR